MTSVHDVNIPPRRRPARGAYLWTALIVIVALVVAVAALCAFIVLTQTPRDVQTAARWRGEKESVDCPHMRTCSKRVATHPVILISLDGFRASYLGLGLTPTLDKVFKPCGVHAKYMLSSYPSKTFSNHYTIVTGLYPESHGIVSNHMFDPEMRPIEHAVFKRGAPSSFNPRWWKGEPIWNTVQKNGLRSATMYWPGSEVRIGGLYPNIYTPYGEIPLSARVDRVIEWLELPETDRPSFITMYFNEPDRQGHEFGPDSPQVNDSLLLVDAAIGNLVDRLSDSGWLPCVNIVVVSDHGMQTVRSAEEGGDISVADFSNMQGVKFYGGAFALSTSSVLEAMQCRRTGMRAFDRRRMPVALHYSRDRRAGDVVIDLDPGYVIYERPEVNEDLGTHGYDYRHESMHALFIAMGPAFKKGYTTSPFQNVELYNMFADILNIGDRAPTNGTEGVLHGILRRPSPLLEPRVPPVAQCPCIDRNMQSCSGVCTQNAYASDGILNDVCVFCEGEKAILLDRPTMTTKAMQFTRRRGGNRFVFRPTRSSVVAATRKLACDGEMLVDDTLPMMRMTLRSLHAESNVRSMYDVTPLHDTFVENILPALSATLDRLMGEWGVARALQTMGVVFDYDLDGLDDRKWNMSAFDESSANFRPSIGTHIWTSLLSCRRWTEDGLSCEDDDVSTINVTAFILPHSEQLHNWCNTSNSFDPHDYIVRHSARLRDVELLSGLQFMTDRRRWPLYDSIELRTRTNKIS